jgi:hypothetical protein
LSKGGRANSAARSNIGGWKWRPEVLYGEMHGAVKLSLCLINPLKTKRVSFI